MRLSIAAGLVFAVALLGVNSGIASAHASLQKCNVKNNQLFRVGHTPAQIVGTFAEDLVPKESFMQVFEGINDHGLVTETQHSRVNFQNPKQMILPLPKHLPVDKYYLIWYTHSAVDKHFAAGIVYFSVVK